jgi:hypothetical protein
MNRQRSVAVGVFENRDQAQTAVRELRRAGFGEDEIGVIARNGENIAPSDGGEWAVQHSRMIEGAAAGMAAGVGVGALWALGIAAGMLPAIGPVIAGGILASLAASAAGGAAVGTLVGSLIGLGIPEEEAEEYHAHFVEGRTIVTVKSNQRYPEAVQILESHGGHVSFPYTGRGETDADQSVVTRGTRPTGLAADAVRRESSDGLEPAGAGGAGLGSRLVDQPIDMTHPLSETLFKHHAGTTQASSSVPDAVGEEVDEPRGTGEPMRPSDSLHFDRADAAGTSDDLQRANVGQRLDPGEPVRASDQQRMGDPLESMPAEEPTSGVMSRSFRVDRASIESATTSQQAGKLPAEAPPNEFDRPA